VKAVYNIDPDQGAVALLTKVTLPGYKVVKITRKGKIATVEYDKVTIGIQIPILDSILVGTSRDLS